MPRQALGRVAAAAAVAVTVVGLLVAAVVAKASTQGEFAFAQAHAGDRWSYSMELGDGWTYGPNDTVRQGVPHEGYHLAWQSPVLVRLADGQLHAAARLDVQGLAYDPPLLPGTTSDDGRHWESYQRSEWLGPGGLLAVELGSGQGAASGSGGISPFGVPVLSSGQGATSYAVVTDYTPKRGLCLADNPVAGRSVSLDAQVHLSHACHLGGVMRIEGDLRLRAGPVESVVGVQALRFDGPGISLWFSPAIPYPVQVHAVANENGGEVTLRMTGFAAGTGALLVPDALADRDPLPALDLVAPRPWGPDDAGLGLDFPLSEAFQRAYDATEFPDLRDYMADHPDAFATGGHLQIEDQQYVVGPVNQTQGEARTWSLSLNSATGCFWFSATRQVSRPEPVPGLGPMPIVLPGEGMQTTYAFNTHPFGCIEDNYEATKPRAPQSWPGVASAITWWAGFASPEERQQGPNGWAFQMRFRDGEWVQEMAVGQAAGQSLRTQTPNSISMTAVSGGGGSLDLEGGHVVSYSRVVTEFRRNQQVAGLTAPSSVAPGNDDAGSIVQRPPPLGQLGPVEATGIGLAAALAALLYWLWPALKGGAFGLFSRIQGDQLLDHPVRAELVQRIEAHPGIHYQDLIRAMDKGKGAIEHHLRKLQEGGRVKVLRSAGYTCFFPAAYDRRLAATAPALKSDGARRILAAIRDHPGESASAITLSTGLSPAVVSHHLQRLGAAGLVVVTRNGRSLVLNATDLANVALAS